MNSAPLAALLLCALSAVAAAQEASLSEARVLLEEARRSAGLRDLPAARGKLGGAVRSVLEAPTGSEEEERVLADLAGFALGIEAFAEARDALERLVELRSSLPEADRRLLAARCNLGKALRLLGDLEGALTHLREAAAAAERALSQDDLELATYRENLAAALWEAGDVPGAGAIFERVLEVREQRLPEDDESLLRARQNAANVSAELGDHEHAREQLLEVLAALERTAGEDSQELQRARVNASALLRRSGSLEEARALLELAVSVMARTLPDDHRELLIARSNLAVMSNDAGDHAGAAEVEAAMLATQQRTLPPDHPDVQRTRLNHAATLLQLGRAAEARDLARAALESRARTLGADHLDVQEARLRLAEALRILGELASAREQCEKALAVLERALPPAHPDLLRARRYLAVVLLAQADHEGARAILESTLAAMEAALAPDDPGLIAALFDLAAVLDQLGDEKAARAAFERVLAARERTLPADDPERLRACLSLARVLRGEGERARARELLERAVSGFERSLPEGHPDLQVARLALAVALAREGELAASRALQEKAMAALSAAHAEHPDLEILRNTHAWTLAALGERGALDLELDALAAGLVRDARRAVVLAPREAQAVAARSHAIVSTLLALADPADADRARGTRIFEAAETVRALAAGDMSAAAGEEALRQEALRWRAAIDEHAARGDAAALADAVLRRDRAEGELRRRLSAAGRVSPPVDAAALAARLPEGTVAVAYQAYTWLEPRDALCGELGAEDRLIAHVLRRGGEPVRVDLGRLEPVRALVARWRSAAGEPVAARGAALAQDGAAAPPEELLALGEELRAAILDPVLAAAGDARTLSICADDVLFLVPLEALPLAEGVVGESRRIVGRASFAARVAAGPPPGESLALVAVGGVDFGAGPGAFSPLPGTLPEAEEVLRLSKDGPGGEPRLLYGEEASVAALLELAPRARHLHLATHGYFADESLRSWQDRDPRSGPSSALRRGATVAGMAPMTLCGLALAEANGGAAGILTAEELAGLDLSRCELAVLSACETNVGLRRAGLGVQSLQAALHAAGAHAVITSLWKVSDEAAKELMVDFYRRLWIERKPAAQALWEAKMALRARGHPLRDWAAWVLSGDLP